MDSNKKRARASASSRVKACREKEAERKLKELHDFLHVHTIGEVATSVKHRCLDGFLDAVSPENIRRVCCCICEKSSLKKECTELSFDDIPAWELLQFDEAKHNPGAFSDFVLQHSDAGQMVMSEFGWREVDDDIVGTVCKGCLHALKNEEIPTDALAYAPNHPGRMPAALTQHEMSEAERLLISPVHARIFIVQLRSYYANKQIGVSNHTICFPSEVPDLALLLPRPNADLAKFLQVT